MDIPALFLNDGRTIPQLGLGTWPLRGEDAAVAVSTAIELGYRHVDTAAKYENEDGVGEGIRRSGIDRGELFITTKLDGGYQGDDRAIAGLRASLDRLGLDYVDLLLIHWPLPARGEFVSTWHTFEALQAEGLARSIGVSNFKPAHLDVLLADSDVVPAVNQVQLSPAIPRLATREYDEANGIVTEAWTPIKGVLNSPVLAAIGEKHVKTAAQVALRWHIQNGVVAIPKTSDPERMAQNADIFDFALDEDDLAVIGTLDEGPNAGVDSDVDGH